VTSHALTDTEELHIVMDAHPRLTAYGYFATGKITISDMSTFDLTVPVAMRAELDRVFAGSLNRQLAPGLRVDLTRCANAWRLTLMSNDPIPHETCDQVATAVSAPSVDWQRNGDGTMAWATWCEGAPVTAVLP